ncbi:MAG: DNA-processing protein DprA [Clostridia bacterium]|nr:DNA-processing protein DprA [Clostridia bacterium]
MFFKKKRETLLYIWLSLACKPGTTTFARLLKWKDYRGPESVYEASDEELDRLLGKSSSASEALKNKELGQAERILNYCEAMNIKIIAYGQKDYPSSFAAIRRPPVLLYCKGELPCTPCMKVGVIGARAMTAYGKKHAFTIASALASAGVLIVSGMARGIDAVASAGALYAKGNTVVFLGCGIDHVYPPEHRLLSQAIEHAGAVVSEYPPGHAGDKYCFPVRNRLISAFSDCVFVVEGDSSSGSLITADAAVTQGKPIFALPGSVDSVTSEAPRILLKRGAHVADCADDILSALSEEYPAELMTKVLAHKEPSLSMIDSVLDVYGIMKEPPLLHRDLDETTTITRASYKTRKRPQEWRTESKESKESKESDSFKSESTEGEPPIKLAEPMHSVYLSMPKDKEVGFDTLCELLPSVDSKSLTTALSRLCVLGLVDSLSGERYKKK